MVKQINYKLGNGNQYRGNYKLVKSTLYELVVLYMRGKEMVKHINYKLGNGNQYRGIYKLSKSTLYELVVLYMRGEVIK